MVHLLVDQKATFEEIAKMTGVVKLKRKER